MARPEAPIPNDAPGPIYSTASKLRIQRAKKNITYREMAAVTNYSHAALSKAASGTVMPSWGIVSAYVSACDGDHDEWKAFWDEAKTALDTLNRTKDLPAVATQRVVAHNIFTDSTSSVSSETWPSHTGPRDLEELSRITMVSLLPKIDRVNTLEELAAVLVTMAARIGLTGSSSISKRTERRGQPIARTTISEALSGERVPRLEVVLGIGRASMALEPEVDALANAWVRVTEARAFQPHMPPPTSQVRAISPARSETYSRRRRRHRDVENYLVILIGIVILATTTLMALTLNK